MTATNAQNTQNPLDLLNLSDEDFEKSVGFPDETGEVDEQATQSEEPSQSEATLPEQEPQQAGEPEQAQAQEQEPEQEETPAQSSQPPQPLTDPRDAGSPDAFHAQEQARAQQPDQSKQDAKSGEAEQAAPVQGTDYKSFYERVMAPFKANGKMIQLRSPEEAIQLMQMGANYTKKMQAIQADRKYLLMLEQNGLKDEGTLSFLIDLHRKDPEAIKKYLKDANVDPVDLDLTEVKYRGTSHAVTDQEVALDTVLSEIKLQEGGPEFLQSVLQWDSASKEALLREPEALLVLNQHRQNGVYRQITDEMERLQTLGQLPMNAPFLQAYRYVGQMLFSHTSNQTTNPVPDNINAASFRSPGAPPHSAVPQAPVPRVVVKTPQSPVQTDPRVKAAAPTRAASRSASVAPNYLALTDEQFEKLPPPV